MVVPAQAVRIGYKTAVIEYLRLVRLRIVAMVLFAMAVAAYATAETAPPWQAVVHSLLGTALVIAGAMAINQRLERRGDASMARTASRPLPAGRLRAAEVTRFGLLLTAFGLVCLMLLGNGTVTALAALSWALYVAIYTPLKSRSVWQTPVGAAAGAMPVLLGAATAGGLFTPTAAALFGIVFFWQYPHSMAIGWLYRDQFARAEVKLATVLDPTGRTAGVLAVLGAVALVPVSLAPLWEGTAGWPYAATAAVLGAGYLAFSAAILRLPNEKTARRLLRASLVYLTLIFVALLMM